jgi:hypothetical protein
MSITRPRTNPIPLDSITTRTESLTSARRDHAATPSVATTTLRDAAATAGQLTDLLDTARDALPRLSLARPDPVYVALDQAAAAAHDLAVNVQTALDALADSQPHEADHDR